MHYIPSLDMYIDIYGMYSADELDYFDHEEKQWKDSLPDYTFNQLVEIFPQAKSAIIRNLKEQIAKAQEDLLRAEQIEKECEDIIYRKSSKENEEYWREFCRILYIDPLREGREKIIKTNNFRLNSLRGRDEIKKGEITEYDIEKAKEHPIHELIRFNTWHKACCIWHEEKTPSLHYYQKGNRVQCYGCGRAEDAIGVYMQLNSVDFITAVKALI